ncbi:DUF4397 domain-containing protein [Mucilaginibacter conchicola]|uniref:DUF4397 domain-containing protein n=1 Tax=Mucilaginibacter conchicola TaxID=2303333 RepID=A0A372NZD3_9SPHI|nr:DUF4397 domain-containing protein [Mucilaginibacter conchicola]RFZ95480.1 DUF4397 domain-containing protein [Mucilaginibacter conchicola]
MKNRIYTYNLLCLLLIALLQVACKKDKLNTVIDNRFTTDNQQSSNIRVVNLGGFSQVIANGDTLTNFKVFGPNEIPNLPGTRYFPTNGQLGKTWTIPQDLFNAQHKIALDLGIYDYNPDLNLGALINLQYDVNNPQDVYLLNKEYTTDLPQYQVLPRAITAPSKPDHFKIRIVNFSGHINNLSVNGSGMQEALDGPVTLAYADGTPVSTQTTNVTGVQKASEYVEVPYGTYQFKVLTANGRQIPGTGSNINELTILDPPTSTIAIRQTTQSNLTYAPIQTYQPGGIYTIVISPQIAKYFINEVDETSNIVQNTFQVISDNSPSANLTYCRVQAVNAMPDNQVSFSVGGTSLGNGLAFGKTGDYATMINGTQEVKATDANGKVIATTTANFRAAQNYTVWLYPDAAGNAKLLLVANDLSGTRFNNAEEDGTYAYFQFKYFFFKRYLNLSMGNPYITFTTDNGNPSGINLQPGQPLLQNPYVSTQFSQAKYDLMAYRSSPNVVPGVWADDIPVLTSDQFIANKALYTNAGRALPAHEPGIFTVALIGKTGTGATTANKARMIILKHNK